MRLVSVRHRRIARGPGRAFDVQHVLPDGARFELNARRAFLSKHREAREGDGEIAVGRMDALGEAGTVVCVPFLSWIRAMRTSIVA